MFRPSRVLSHLFVLPRRNRVSLSQNLSAVERIFSGSSPSVDLAGDLGLLGVLPLSILLAEEPFGLLSLDSLGPWVVSSLACLSRWLSSALSLFLALYLSRFLSYGSPFGLLSLDSSRQWKTTNLECIFQFVIVFFTYLCFEVLY